MTTESFSERREAVLRDEFVELNKLLKFENLVSSGGEAKNAILAGLVKVDGEVETRIRKKLSAGNVIVFGDVEITIAAKVE